MTSFFVLPVASHISSSFLIKSRGNLAETTAVSPVYFFEDITSFFSANVNTSFNQTSKTNYTQFIVLQKFTKVNNTIFEIKLIKMFGVGGGIFLPPSATTIK